MSSPMQPQSPYRLAMPATLTTSTMATTSTSSSTGISSTIPSVVSSTAPAPVISSVSTSSTVSVSAMSTVFTSSSTVTSPIASVPSASSASSTAAASTCYLTTDPGIPGPGSFFCDNTRDSRDWVKAFQSWSNIKNVSKGTINMSSMTQLNPFLHRQQQRMDNISNRHVLKEHGTHPTNLSTISTARCTTTANSMESAESSTAYIGESRIMSAIASFFAQRSVFITGGSGYIGQQTIEKLLRSCPEIESIYVLTRPKKGQNAQQRMDKLTSSPLFDRLRSRQPSFSRKIIAINGDVEQPGMGINGYDHSRITANASLFIHSAASISFTDPIRKEAQTNLIGTMNAIQLCKEFKQPEAFVFLSSVVSQADKTSIKECIYDPPINSRQLLDLLDILDDRQIELLAPSIMRQIPNTYGLTKAVTEHHISQAMDDIPTAIVRMSSIGPALAEPVEGWVDNITASNGVFAGIGLGMLPVLDCTGESLVDITPVDVVTNFIIATAWHTATNKSKDASSPVKVYNFVTGNKSPLTMKEFTHLCATNSQQYPLSKRITKSGSCTSRNKALQAMSSYWLKLRCMAVDSYLRLAGQTPKAMKLFRLNQAMSGSYEFFINQTNHWDEHHVQEVEDRLTPTDKQTFSVDRKIDMDHYYKVSWLGMKKYYFKDVPKEERSPVVETEATYNTVGNKELKSN